jgi:phosphoribosylaminoimidazolecarboxamide formyltransferase/IMP cyclohydrolase
MYPLEQAIAEGKSYEEVVEMMDIGGPAMLSSASKGGRIVICDPADRQKVIDWLKDGCPDDVEFRRQLAAKADFIVSQYRSLTANHSSDGKYIGIFGERVAECKYGENAYQSPAALYSCGTDDPLALDQFVVIEGTPLSYNNFCDVDRLLQTVSHIDATFAINKDASTAIAVGAKHGNPCGTATTATIITAGAAGTDRSEVLKNMMLGDPLAIFGGLVMTNFEVDAESCEVLVGKMLDGIIAPAFTDVAIDMLRRKGDRCRFVVNPALGDLSLDTATRFRYVRGGLLVQPNYTFIPDFGHGDIVKHGSATSAQEYNMMLAWAIGSTSNSNTITLVKNGQLIGNAVGQQDRVGAANLAITRAQRSGHDVTGAVAYSDSFFPFTDGPQTLIDAGVTAIFTSSGSIKDHEVIDVCAEHSVVLYMVPDKDGRGFYGH